jgi:uncharacterized protein
MLSNDFIEKCESFLTTISKDHDAGHDLNHIRRVRLNALNINQKDAITNNTIVELCAMFHDSLDSKFIVNTDETCNKVVSFLTLEGVSDADINTVLYVAQNISYSQGDKRGKMTPELAVVMDADRLDAIGAIGVARAFTYGGFRSRPLYTVDGRGSTIGHFYEKLLLLRDLMNTVTGRIMAQERHNFMLGFLKEFEQETGFFLNNLKETRYEDKK